MATIPATSDFAGEFDGLPDGIHACAIRAPEYTPKHRELWPQLLRTRDAESLRPTEMKSWQRLWGPTGGELFMCFTRGDDHVRSDMIRLAKDDGGWRGELIAARLRRWMEELR